MSWVGTWTFEIPPNHVLEFLQCARLNVELPFQVGTHLALYLVNLLPGALGRSSIETVHWDTMALSDLFGGCTSG